MSYKDTANVALCAPSALTRAVNHRRRDMKMKRLLPALGLGLWLAAPVAAQAPMTAIDSARHVLNRLAYGATPGEIEAVAHEGVMKWVDRQLGYTDVHDPALADIERNFDVLRMSRFELQDLQQKNQARNQQAQAISDTVARQKMLDDLRMEQQTDRRSLQGLIAQLNAVTMIRAVESDRQLDEVLVDFWTNHFNVFIDKGQDRSYFADYLDKTIRGHALGKFEDILVATAKSPAMLFYLDNAESVADGTPAMGRGRGGLAIQPAFGGGRGLFPNPRPGVYPPNNNNPNMVAPQQAGQQRAAPRGLNENYARELMELHTLGVDGGYSQQDVINVARILTGWSINRQDASYIFRPLAHDYQPKLVLGREVRRQPCRRRRDAPAEDARRRAGDDASCERAALRPLRQ